MATHSKYSTTIYWVSIMHQALICTLGTQQWTDKYPHPVGFTFQQGLGELSISVYNKYNSNNLNDMLQIDKRVQEGKSREG